MPHKAPLQIERSYTVSFWGGCSTLLDAKEWGINL
jgi:hypothetical protein